jgi:microcystin-dependent protein
MAYSAIPIIGGGGGSDGRRILNTWTVPSGHGFAAGSVVVYKGGVTGFALGLADDLATSQTVGVVEAASTESITVVYQGEIDFEGAALDIDDGATSLTAGNVYYLSPTNAGYLTPIRPFDGASYIQGMIVATDTDKGFVINALPQTSSASLFSPVGSMIPWAGSFQTVPSTWRICDGAAVRKSGATPIDGEIYSHLYEIIGDKYKVTGLVSSTTGPVGNTARDIIISFSAEGHEDYPGTTAHGLVDAYNNDTNRDYKIGWGGTNDYAIGSLTGANTVEARFQYKRTYPGCTPVNFSGAVASSQVTIQSLQAGEATGATCDRFFIPDMRARTAFGVGYSSGLTELKRGDIGGDDTHLLASNEIPDHNNYLYTTESSSGGGTNRTAIAAAQRDVDVNLTTSYQAGFTADNEPISMMPPYVATNWIIRHRQFQGPGIEIGPKGPTGFGCSAYVVSNQKVGSCWTLVLGFTGGVGCTGTTYGLTTCDGSDGEQGEQGEQGERGERGDQGPRGTQGQQGNDGRPCICVYAGQGLVDSLYFSPSSPYKDGIAGNANATLLSANLSMDPLYPTDFAYAMSVFRSDNTTPSTKAPFYFRDPSNSVNESSFVYGKTLTTPTNPNVDIQRSSVYSLSVINDSASSFYQPLDIVLSQGVYTLDRPWYNFINRDLYIRAANNSVVTQTVKGITFLPLYTALGATDTTRFALQVNIGTAQSMVAATGCGIRFLPPLSIVSGVTSSNGISSGFDGLTSGTGGLMNMLVGGHEVVGISGQYFTINVKNEGSQTFGNLLNQTFTNYINAVDIYRVTVHTTSSGGALFTNRNTRTFVGDWAVGATESDGIAFINHSTTAALNDQSMTPYISGGAYSNAIAMQTDGGIIKARGCLFVDYPVAAHAYDGGTITLGHCVVSGSYYGFAVDSGSNAEIAGSIFSRNSFPIISEGGTVKITHDLTKIGKTHIKGNRAPTTALNSNLEMGSTDINGAGILAVNANVRIKDFTRILSDTGFNKGGLSASIYDGTEQNKFAIMAINSNVSSPDMLGTAAGSRGISGTDFVTGLQVPKFQGSGRVQGLNSKIVLTTSKTNFSTMVDTVNVEDTIKGDIDQIPIP